MSAAVQAVPDVDGAPPEEGKGSKLKLIIAAAVVLAVAAVGAFMFLGGGGEEAADEAMEPVPMEMSSTEGEVVEVATMTVNLAGEQLRYAQVGFAVVLSMEADSSLVEGRFPLLQDAALTELSQFEPDELRTTEGMERLRAVLTARAAELWPDGEVLRVVLTGLLVQ